MAELTDATVLGAVVERREGLNPSKPTSVPRLEKLANSGDLKSPARKGLSVRVAYRGPATIRSRVKLYINKDKCRYYVDVVTNSSYLKRHKQLACFRHYEKAHRGRIGTITLRSDTDTATVAHELVHAALYFIQAYASEEVRKLGDVELDNYIHESSACVVENMLRQYLTKVR